MGPCSEEGVQVVPARARSSRTVHDQVARTYRRPKRARSAAQPGCVAPKAEGGGGGRGNHGWLKKVSKKETAVRVARHQGNWRVEPVYVASNNFGYLVFRVWFACSTPLSGKMSADTAVLQPPVCRFLLDRFSLSSLSSLSSRS